MEVDMMRMMYRAYICTLIVGCAVAQGEWDIVGFSDCSVRCVAQHPADTAIMYISIADTLYRSSDGGQTWAYALSFNGLPVNDLQFHPVDPSTVCALVGNGSWSDGIYYSTDAGYTWDILSYIYKPLTLTIPEDSGSLWMAGCDTFGVYKSTDGGMTWTLWNEGLTNLHINSLSHTWRSDTLTFLAGTAQGLFCRSADAWSLCDGIPDMLPVVSVTHHRTAAFGYAAVGNGSYSDGIYMTTDHGEGWQVAEWWVFPSCVAMSAMWEYPVDSCTILAGDSGLGVKRSTDYGGTWYALNTGLDNLFINEFSYHRQTPLRLFAGTDGGLYRFIYESACKEQMAAQVRMALSVQPTVIRSGQPIIICLPAERNALIHASVSIFNACGRLVRTVPLENGAAEISLSEPCGTYFVQVSGMPACSHRKVIVVE